MWKSVGSSMIFAECSVVLDEEDRDDREAKAGRCGTDNSANRPRPSPGGRDATPVSRGYSLHRHGLSANKGPPQAMARLAAAA